jgi:AGZA family xanthine/uracil permease-like MFS transporter
MVRSAENDGPVGPPVGALGRVKKELVDFKNGLSVGGGDLGSLGQLFFDNLSTLLGAIFAMQNMTNFGVSRDLIDDTIFGKIVPGVGLTLVVGNIYYSWQAVRLTTLHGRQYTAQPYGLNTVGIFAFIFNIIYPVYFTSVDAVGPSEAFLTAYKVAIAANFITGLLSVVFGIIGPTLLRMIPPAALLVPIAGIGFSFLGLEQLTTTLAAPLVGYLAIMWVYLGWYAGVKIGWGKFRIPEAVTVILVGVVMGWITGLNDASAVRSASKLVKWSAPVWSGDDLFADFSEIGDYLGIIIPIAIASSSATLM